MPLYGVLEAARRINGKDSSSSALVEMWRNNLRKSQQRQAQRAQPLPQSFSINFTFDGITTTPTGGSAALSLITFPCRILGCRIYAGDGQLQPQTATASFDLRLGLSSAWVQGAANVWVLTPPAITSAVEADVDITGWIVDLEPDDLLLCSLSSVTESLATWIVLSLPMKRLDVTSTSTATVTDSFGDTLVTADGEEIVLRG